MCVSAATGDGAAEGRSRGGRGGDRREQRKVCLSPSVYLSDERACVNRRRRRRPNAMHGRGRQPLSLQQSRHESPRPESGATAAAAAVVFVLSAKLE